MDILSTRSAAKKLGLSVATLARYIAMRKLPAPKTVSLGGLRVHAWSERDIKRVRKLLPKIKNGRKFRYKKNAKKK
jgi:predicted DNA-binding transcriptional regulator AlpA